MVWENDSLGTGYEAGENVEGAIGPRFVGSKLVRETISLAKIRSFRSS